MTPEGNINVSSEAPAPVAPSAPAPSAPAPAPAPVAAPVESPSPSIAPAADSLSDILAGVRQGDAEFQRAAPAPAPVVEPTPAVAPAVTPPVEEPPVPAPAPTPAPDAPPPDIAAAPAAEPEPESTIPAPESALAPIFQLGHTDDAVATSIETFEGLRYTDPIAFDNLIHGAFFADEERITGFVLQRQGIPADKIQEFTDYLKSGQALPAASAPPPFPVPNAEGLVTIDGNELDLSVDPTTGRAKFPADRMAYDNAKKLYDIELRDQARTAEERTASEQARQAAAKQVREFHDDCFKEASNTYLTERTSLIDTLIAPALADLAPEDALFGEMFKSHVELAIKNSPEMSRLALSASEHMVAIVADTIQRSQRANLSPAQTKAACVARLKEGRMVNFAAEQDSLLRRQITQLKNDFINATLRRNRAEIAATSTRPVVPENARQVESIAPPLINNDQPQTLQDILAGVRQYDAEEYARQRG